MNLCLRYLLTSAMDYLFTGHCSQGSQVVIEMSSKTKIVALRIQYVTQKV